MESLTVCSRTCSRPLGCFLLAVCCLPALAATGCVTWHSLAPGSHSLPTGAVCQVVATWTNQVAWTPDPTRGGKPAPGFAGRLYLFGPEIDFPLVADGSVVVDLYDAGAVGPDGQPAMLEQWNLDKENLRRLLKRDAIGWGYTLFLPWGTYRPDITRVELKLRFVPEKGPLPLYAASSPLTLTAESETGPALAGRNSTPPAGAATTRRAAPGVITPTAASTPSSGAAPMPAITRIR
jgi:hypothetical protein